LSAGTVTWGSERLGICVEHNIKQLLALEPAPFYSLAATIVLAKLGFV
jgi:hypothetical protein